MCAITDRATKARVMSDLERSLKVALSELQQGLILSHVNPGTDVAWLSLVSTIRVVQGRAAIEKIANEIVTAHDRYTDDRGFHP